MLAELPNCTALAGDRRNSGKGGWRASFSERRALYFSAPSVELMGRRCEDPGWREQSGAVSRRDHNVGPLERQWGAIPHGSLVALVDEDRAVEDEERDWDLREGRSDVERVITSVITSTSNVLHN